MSEAEISGGNLGQSCSEELEAALRQVREAEGAVFFSSRQSPQESENFIARVSRAKEDVLLVDLDVSAALSKSILEAYAPRTCPFLKVGEESGDAGRRLLYQDDAVEEALAAYEEEQAEREMEEVSALIAREARVLFIKGTPRKPQCGFTSQLIQLLSRSGLEESDYVGVDILSRPRVRQGMKKRSDWPTYPQVYVRGEFIGGLDVLRELERAGELEKALGLGSEAEK